ncbi:thioredoxin domain-containing protein [Geitlerinema sp. PCC 9228]|uniref:thioredoxin domain-containing protein n=1 Tax=Geitlerinema sp. PCC 9228 TaxID=111611 RepID=UPI0008F9CA39|nr:thioredoxin domain-containing protein [Geitlerinema sp. PCC 9228]
MTNRLIETQSLYLRKHAENPIDWWYWCDEALNQARQEDKPIFLSIGYSSCHWCTVMEGEAFSNPQIAEYMNANFLPIKVDREERPDIDSIYMQALQMMTGQGGWPLNIFLSPDDLVPFYGGTYFPVEPRFGMPGFMQVLQAIRRFYDTEKTKLQSVKQEIYQNLRQTAVVPGTGEEFPPELLQKGAEVNTKVLSFEGFGNSFPMIPYAENVLRSSRFSGISQEHDPKQAAVQRGIVLATGGICDHVAGGFHRYTVDATWTVPHFEKMLYDNGQILEYLANLWSAGIKESVFQEAMAGILAWLRREMTAPEGYFYASQDADSFTNPDDEEPEEGGFYVWQYQDLEYLLDSEEMMALESAFTVSPQGNFEGHNVLQRRTRDPLSDAAKSALRKLFRIRYGHNPEAIDTFPPATNNQEAKTGNWEGRIPPVTDTKAIVAWNSLTISGLARAYAVLGEIEYLQPAVRAAQFILNHQWVNGRLHRVNYNGEAAVPAQGEDYALLVKALLDLHQASLREGTAAQTGVEAQTWLEKAMQVQKEFDDRMYCVEMGGYFNTAEDSSNELLVRERSYMDNATPSTNGVAAGNLVRLAMLSRDLQYLDHAKETIQSFDKIMTETPQACPVLFSALDWYQNYTVVRTSRDRLGELLGSYLPACVLQVESALPAGAIALVCQGLTCKEPSQTPEHMWEQIQFSQNRHL